MYVPASNKRAIEKAKVLNADAIIFDLEDSVPPNEKIEARNHIEGVVKNNGREFGEKKLIIRINSLDTEWGVKDLSAVINSVPHAVLLPKVDTPEVVERVETVLDSSDKNPIKVWAMVETALGVINANKVALEGRRLEALILGTNDLVKELRAKETQNRNELLYALSHVLLVARAYNLVCIDGVYNSFNDDQGLKLACGQSRNMGFDGKTLIHPKQVSITNEVFSPSPAEVVQAKQIIDCYKSALREGKGVAVFNGKIVENLHVETAKRIVSFSQIIDNQE